MKTAAIALLALFMTGCAAYSPVQLNEKNALNEMHKAEIVIRDLNNERIDYEVRIKILEQHHKLTVEELKEAKKLRKQAENALKELMHENHKR